MLNGRRVLIVEDEALIAMDLVDIVESDAGYVVGPFRTNREAIAALAREQVDVAILDLNLADGDATPTARFLFAAGVPILVCTAGILPRAIRQLCPDLPVHQKPVRSDRLLGTLCALCGTERMASFQAASGAAPTSCLA